MNSCAWKGAEVQISILPCRAARAVLSCSNEVVQLSCSPEALLLGEKKDQTAKKDDDAVWGDGSRL